VQAAPSVVSIVQEPGGHMRAAMSLLTLLALVSTTMRWGHTDTTVGATREIPDGEIDFTPAIPDLSLESGQYAPRIALEVLPAPNAFAPDLSVVYSAKRDNGPLGQGWGLAFESMIERKGTRGGVPDLTSSDTFWIDGARLVETTNGTYRTEQNDFTVYTQIHDLLGRTIGWSAKKDGLTRYYGKSTWLDNFSGNAVEYRDEVVTNGVAGGIEQVGWRLSQARSAFGGTITYTYAIHGTRRHLPDKITYASTASARTEVTFGYEARDDVRTSRANGPKRTEPKRLRRILVKRIGTATATAFYYLFRYQTAAHSPQSMLTEVKRVSVADPLAPPTQATEDSVAFESLGRFAYSDAETTWGEREALSLIGDPPLATPGADQQSFSVSMLVDVDADALPDLVVFHDLCDEASLDDIPGPDLPHDPDPDAVQISGIFTCVGDHRVYLNRIVEVRTPIDGIPAGRAAEAVITSAHAFVYDQPRSEQLTDFYDSLHQQSAGTLEAQPIVITDVNRDGFADLIKPLRISVGSAEGWNPSGLAANWSEAHLEDGTFADFNGDGFPDLVAQSEVRLNSGYFPYIDSFGTSFDDPVVDDGATPLYTTPQAARCMDDTDTGIFIRSDYGVSEAGPAATPRTGTGITAPEWVWRNTINGDFNRDGIMDRAYAIPFLQKETSVQSPGGVDMWFRNDEDCGVYDQVFLGNGDGGFVAAEHGIGGPMQRDDEVVQVRTLSNGGNMDIFTFSYPVNHFAMADVDGDGRDEVTQFCSNDSQFVALWDRGTAGPGFGLVLNGTCPAQQHTASVPEQFFGLSMLDYHYSTVADIDGDGFADLFQFSRPYGPLNAVVDNTGTPWETWDDGPHWRPNQRTTAQNRLLSITWPHGETTEVRWAWSAADPGNRIPINIEHVRSITNANGRSVYSFEGGVFDDGEFMGFSRVETLQPRGSTLVETFFTARALRGKRSTEELYDGGGRLKNLRVHLHGSDDVNVIPVGGGFGYDGIAPYYNPLLRRCEFELGAFNVMVPLSTNISGYIDICEDYAGEPGAYEWSGGLSSDTASSVARGADPKTIAASPAERRELTALRDLLAGRDPTPICTRTPDQGNLPPPPQVCRRFTTTPGDRADASVFGPDSGPGSAMAFSDAAYTSRWDTAIKSDASAPWQDPGLVLEAGERMFVNEYSYSFADGHIVEHRELRDTSTTADSLVHEFEYSAWDAGFAGVYLEHEITRNTAFTTYEDIDYESFENGLWKTRVEHDTQTGATRTEKRTFTALGDISASANGLDEWTFYGYSDCGVLTSTISPSPVAYLDEAVLDAACRPNIQRRMRSSTILARTSFLRDGYGRVTSQTTNPAFGSGVMPVVTTEFAYDGASAAGSPSHVEIAPEPDGSTTLTKTYVDGWGREIKRVRCSAIAATGGAGLDAAYPCDADTEVVTETSYAESTGEVAAVVGPYLAADSLRPTTEWEYDEHGRKVLERDPLGGTTTYSYGLGVRSAVDAVGRRTQVKFTTLAEDVTVNSVYRGGTRRDAFGRITATIDPASNVTSIGYDGYNRKLRELSPIVEVWASGATAGISQRLTVEYGYDLADRLTSVEDGNGRVTEQTFDADGRLLTTTGPDRDGDGSPDLLESRSYVDGGYGVAKVVITDEQLDATREEHLDGQGRVWKQVAFDGTTTRTDYDSRGRAWRTSLPWGEIRTTELHDGGLTAVATSRQGSVIAATTTTLDAAGRPLTVIDPDGQVVTHAYDLAGQLETTWEGSREREYRAYDSVGRATQVRTAGALTCLNYDDFDQVILEERGCLYDGLRVVDADSGRGLVNIERSYTAVGKVDTETDGTGVVVDHDYDALGNLTGVKITDANGVAHGTASIAYDGVGNATKETDEVGLVTRTEYDVYDDVTAVVGPSTGRVETTYAVDAGSWVATTTTATGDTSEQRTDAMGRTWRTCAPDGTCVEDHYTDGRLTTRIRRIAPVAIDAATQYITYHPGSTRVASETDWLSFGEVLACGANPPGGCTVPQIQRTWTTAGRPDLVIDAQGNATDHAYDPTDDSFVLGRITQPGMPDQELVYDPDYPIVIERRLHDPTGLAADVIERIHRERDYQIDSVTRTQGWLVEAVSLDYDDAGRATQRIATRATETVAITDAYDWRGNPVTRAYAITPSSGAPYAATLGMTWRDNGQLASVRYPSSQRQVTYAYDDPLTPGRLKSVKLGAAKVFEALDPDASGRARTLKFDSNAMRVERTFDTAGREQTRNLFGTTAQTRSENYGYDDYGRLAAVGVTYGPNTASSVFHYSFRDRLVDESHTLNGTTRRVDYDYDPGTGLRVTKTDTTGGLPVVTDYDYDDGNRLALVDAAQIAWDGFGRQSTDAAGRTFVWGLSNQLLSISEGGIAIETNLFDAEGLRVSRTTPAGGREYFLPGPDGAVIEHVAGTTITDYVRLPGGTTVATIDHTTGNVTGVVESITGSPYRMGERTGSHLYVDTTAFGEPIRTDGTLAEDLGFHGMFATEAAEIQLAGVRAYDVTTGRFLTPDPLGYDSAPEAVDAGDFYRYAQDNPVGMMDPTGYSARPIGPRCVESAEGGCIELTAHYEPTVGVEAAKAREAARQAAKAEEKAEKEAAKTKAAGLIDGSQAEEEEATGSREVGDTELTSEPVDSGSSGEPRPRRAQRMRASQTHASRRGSHAKGDDGEIVVVGKMTDEARKNRNWDRAQRVLDVIGMIDPIGVLADLANAVISGLRGDKLGAALSLTAMIPFIGTAAASAKWVRKAFEMGTATAMATGAAKRLWATTKIGRKVALYDTLDEIVGARKLDYFLGADPRLAANNKLVVNGAIGEDLVAENRRLLGMFKHPSAMGRNGLDGIYSTGGDLENLHVEEVKVVLGWFPGSSVAAKLSKGSKGVQGSGRYILTQGRLMLKSKDPEVRKMGAAILNARTITSTVTVVDRYGNMFPHSLGTMERVGDQWKLIGNDILRAE
jgi:RHS repeat-associated protein